MKQAMHKRGFSLVEVAVVLVVSGLIASVALQLTRAGSRNHCMEKTTEDLKTINGALEHYARKNDRFPLPADRKVGTSNPRFGREDTDPTHANIEYDPATVSRGALPFQELGLPTGYAADCWDNKYTYVVTTEYTTKTGYENHATQNKITVLGDPSGSGVSSPNAAYAVISHGENGKGAVSRNYEASGGGSVTTSSWCHGSDPHIMDFANCSPLNSGTLYAAHFNDGQGNNTAHPEEFFDDIVIFHGRPFMPSPCLPQRTTWDSNCEGYADPAMNPPAIVSFPVAHSATVTFTNTLTGTPPTAYIGSATMKCNDGVFQVDPSQPHSCVPATQCSGPISWTNGTNTCSGTMSAIASGAQATVTDSTDPTNTATVSCNAGTPTVTNPICNVACQHPCVANGYRGWNAPVSIKNGYSYCIWGEDSLMNSPCSGVNAFEVQIRDCATGADIQPCTGASNIYSCNINGQNAFDKWVSHNPTEYVLQCSPSISPCTGTVNWGTSNACSANIGTIPNSSMSSVTSTSSTGTGTATVSCVYGRPVVSSPVCTPTYVWHIKASGVMIGPNNCLGIVGQQAGTISEGAPCTNYHPSNWSCIEANDQYKINCGGSPIP